MATRVTLEPSWPATANRGAWTASSPGNGMEDSADSANAPLKFVAGMDAPAVGNKSRGVRISIDGNRAVSCGLSSDAERAGKDSEGNEAGSRVIANGGSISSGISCDANLGRDATTSGVAAVGPTEFSIGDGGLAARDNAI